jgi:hypothetical protein
MNKTAQQSLLDILVQIMPALQDFKSKILNSKNPVNDSLFAMWEGSSKTSNRKFLKPKNIKSSEISKMELAGLIEDQGQYIKVTEKGAQTIKTMILNDNSFALDKKASSYKKLGWYDKIKYEDYLS